MMMRIIVLSWGIFYTGIQIWSCYAGVGEHESLFYTAILYTVLMLIMSFVYTYVLVKLNKKMNELPEQF